MPQQWLTADETAARLGVRLQTLYAYVSRGLLHSHPVPGGGRVSRYDRAEVERLAAGSHRGAGRAGALELVVDTHLTLLDPAGHLYYRGWDATDAARTGSYERVAEWLWTGRDDGEPPTWVPAAGAVGAITSATARLAVAATPVDWMRVATAVAATGDPLRHDRRPEAVAMLGRSLVAALVDTLPRPARAEAGADVALHLPSGPSRRGSIAGRLWRRLSPRRPRRRELAALNAALVLLADHELAVSTLAARITASTWADPYLVLQAGLAALGGPLHGGTAEPVRELLVEVVAGRPAAEAVGERLRSGQPLPGVGHAVYRGADPRAGALLAAIEAARPPARRWRAVQDVVGVLTARDLPPANVDLALGALCVCFELADGAGQVIFAVARCAGWLAHAIEEYEHALRFRPRAVYLGPAPRS